MADDPKIPDLPEDSDPTIGDLKRRAKAIVDRLKEKYPDLKVGERDNGCTIAVALNAYSNGIYILKMFDPERDGHRGWKLVELSLAIETLDRISQDQILFCRETVAFNRRSDVTDQ